VGSGENPKLVDDGTAAKVASSLQRDNVGHFTAGCWSTADNVAIAHSALGSVASKWTRKKWASVACECETDKGEQNQKLHCCTEDLGLFSSERGGKGRHRG